MNRSIRRWLRPAGLLAAGALAAASLAFASPASALPASGGTLPNCSRSISTSGNADSVVITLHQTCGDSYRAIGLWGGGTHNGLHYGTYHKWPGGSAQFSTACAVSACNAGTVQWGGYQRKSDGKIFCKFGACSSRLRT